MIKRMVLKNDYEKLEYIHYVIQECMNNNFGECCHHNDYTILKTALAFVEDIREPHLKGKINGN